MCVCVSLLHPLVFFFFKLYTYRQLVVCSPNRTIIRIVHRWSSLCILLSRISAFALVSAIPNRVHGKCNSQQAVSSVSSVFVLKYEQESLFRRSVSSAVIFIKPLSRFQSALQVAVCTERLCDRSFVVSLYRYNIAIG